MKHLPVPIFNAAEREAALAAMEEASSVFYRKAVATECHPFIEFCGLINKYIDLCRAAHHAGVDFMSASTHSGVPLPVANHDMGYLAEKLDCIFGPTLQSSSEARLAFLAGLGLS